MSGRHDLTIDAGADFNETVNWQFADGTPHDLSGGTVAAEVRARLLHHDPDADPVLTLTVDGDAEGNIYLHADPDDTALVPPGEYVWDLAVEAEGATRRLLRGAVRVNGMVTDVGEES